MKAKRILALFLAAASIFTFAACGKDKKDNEEYTGFSEGLTGDGYFANVKAADIVTLPEYKGIEIKKSDITVTEDEINEQIEGILSQYETYEEIKEGVVEDGATLNIDYVGSVDGVEFEGGSTGGAGTTVTIGVTNYIDDFLDQLVGHSVGENFDIEVTFPEDYGNEELNGKDAVFNITINYICGDIIKAELTDDIAKDYGFDTVKELTDDIERWIQSNKNYTIANDVLSKAVCESIPDSVIDFMVNEEIMSAAGYASMFGMTAEEYFLSYNECESVEEYIEKNKDLYTEAAIIYLASQAIAEIEGLTVTTEEIGEYGYADYIEEYGEPYFKRMCLVQNKIPAFIIENGNVIE